MSYSHGEDVRYECSLLETDDTKKLRLFSCGNEKLDKFFHEEIITNGEVNVDDGLPFKICDKQTGEIIAIYSLAASGIIYRVGSYSHVLPAIKIDVFAVDKRFQKMHWDKESEESENSDEHFYFSDRILCDVVNQCHEISETMMHAKYIVLYADVKAKRFYKRNLFNDFSEYMEKEKNCEIKKNDPMYLELD